MCIHLYGESKYLNKTETHIQRIIHTNSYKLPSAAARGKRVERGAKYEWNQKVQTASYKIAVTRISS